MTNVFADVAAFHNKFGLPSCPGVRPHLLAPDVQTYRERFLQEELDEFKDAYAAGDLAKAADALADLVYVACGTAHFMGLPFNLHWAEVQRANMDKVKGDVSKARTDGLGDVGARFEIAKPPGWREPDHATILREHIERYHGANPL